MTVSGIPPIFAAAQQGLAQAGVRAAGAAERMVAATGEGNLTGAVEAAVDLRSAELQTKAAAKAVKSADECLGCLLDLKA
jgi:hypothetical protein